ncbi:MAG: helicase-exonuclease AddAB subunit AddA [Bacillota bacterium]
MNDVNIPEPWTPQQWAAITGRGRNLLVAAAAGSGKTAVLVERVIRLLDGEPPVDIDRLLVVTFTEAAAAQMRGRIAAALERAREADPDNPAPARQLALLGRASISTIHSFCLGVLRRHFYRLGLDPAFRVMDEGESALLGQDVLTALLERAYEAGGDSFTRLADSFGGNAGADLEQLVLSVYHYARSQPRPLEWLKRVAQAFDLPEGTQVDQVPWAGPVLAEARRRLCEAAAWMAEARELAARPAGPHAYLPVLESDAAVIAGVQAAASSWDQLASALGNGLAFARLPGVRKKEVDVDLQEACKYARDQAKGILSGLAKGIFARPGAELVEELRRVGPLMETLTGLVTQFYHDYQEAKAERAQVDFNDLEHFCLQLLWEDDGSGRLLPSDVARELQERYTEVLVDEYQDVNGVQDAILTLVSRQAGPHPNLFMVGDVKQSIYRFRLADPGLFLGHYSRYPREPGGREQLIDLSSNFRSDHTVLDGVNFLFRQLMDGQVGEIAYDRAAELVPGRTVPYSGHPPVEVCLCERKPASGEPGEEPQEDGVPPEEEEDLTALEREAHLAAGLVKAMVGGSTPFRFYDLHLKETRAASYRDVVILMRATRERANVVTEVFRDLGIPIYAELGTGYFAASEVEVALALLRVTDNPRQDIPLATVLRSPAVGLDAAELSRVRLKSRHTAFYDAVKAAASDPGLGATSRKLAEFLSRLESWRTAARRGPLSRLVWQVLEDTRYYDYCGGMPGGSQRQANLRALYDRARQFDGFARQGLFRFLRFVERLRESQDLGSAPALGEDEDVVRVMSVHKSKGLEFPIVILLDAGKAFNWRDLYGDVLCHRDLGLGPRVVDPDRRIKYPSLAHTAVACQRRLEALAEEMRVLYVAMTRAREKLVVVGSARDLEGKCRRWATATRVMGWPLPDAWLARAGTWLDWLGPALARHAAGRAICEHGQSPLEVLDARVRDDPSAWTVTILPASGRLRAQAGEGEDLGGLTWQEIRELKLPSTPPDPVLAAEVAKRLDWSYPQARLAERAAKVSVSELKRLYDPSREDAEDRSARHRPPFPRPQFLTAGGVRPSGAELGTGVHTVMQHLDLEGPLDVLDIARQVEDMVQRELLLPAVARAIDPVPLAAFFQSLLGRRLVQARTTVRREIPFTLAVPAQELYEELDGPGEFVVVQGIIDCAFAHAGGLVLLDFKTDREGEKTRLLPAYRQQVSIYRRALSGATGKAVTEAYLVFLATGTAVPVA